jgi:hypothetical protein
MTLANTLIGGTLVKITVHGVPVDADSVAVQVDGGDLKHRVPVRGIRVCKHLVAIVQAIRVRISSVLEKYLKSGSGRAFAKRHLW